MFINYTNYLYTYLYSVFRHFLLICLLECWLYYIICYLLPHKVSQVYNL